MFLLGIDIGTSFIKVSAVDAETRLCIASAQFPEQEAGIIALQSGWAEQSPETWWQYTIAAIQKLNSTKKYDPKLIAAIGIAYQMHGLVVVDKKQNVLRNAIIWCDSRAVEIGENAYKEMGENSCNSCLLNSPGNFTASKLAWVKKNEPNIFKQVDKMMLPGDFIAMKLTGKITTTPSALSEGIFWDFTKEEISKDILHHFEFDENILPEIRPVFGLHGYLEKKVADELGLTTGIPITYKAGDQLNNALSLNVLQPGEAAATAGTSGVIYAVTDQLITDPHSRINAFAHVNHTTQKKRLGILLCINGTGIMNSWIKKLCGEEYENMNAAAARVKSDGLFVLPFGNGAERMLENKMMGAHISGIDLNKHSRAHLYRSVQEGIAFAFRYGMDILRENAIELSVIRAGKANMFLSDIFTEAFVNATGVPVEFYETDGSIGAALGAGIGAGIFTFDEAFKNLKPIQKIEPAQTQLYNELYQTWKQRLNDLL